MKNIIHQLSANCQFSLVKVITNYTKYTLKELINSGCQLTTFSRQISQNQLLYQQWKYLQVDERVCCDNQHQLKINANLLSQ